ncbi:hypothetical protein HO173_009579 [Letharia columbiana]|uniref:Uncharacterized protein n=1 Tax=Letharia columbiana TaxID=112416 RepID=A0A8H6FP88_9LECA|nr:uncharacterized protein HO173_009579 [Letharia columbiana]KAF6232196.1 hypothetical protein HO173_009579 [Letharia columbiana]
MGQRHQLFVIASINARYRTLCAIHHQWLYGHTALRRCLGTLQIFADPANRIPLEQELIAAQRQDDDFWTPPEDGFHEKNVHVPFPFIATCLITGASFGPDDGYYHPVLVENFYMAYDEGDNNNGITVFDITEPSNVRYCFVDFYGMESERSVQLMAPLTARIYLEAYYDLSDPQSAEDLPPLLDEFNRWHTIPVATLQDTWPEGEWEEPEFGQGGGDEVAVPELEKPGTAKTLRDGAMATVLKALLDAPDEDAGLLSEAELLTDFLPRLKDRLYEQANALEPSPHLLNLLCRALEDHDDVDLSPFKAFSAEDLSLVVSRLRKHGKMITLCMSNRPDLTEEDLKLVLHDAADLKALYILEAPQISVQGMSMFLSDCDLYHSDLLRQAIKPQPLRSDTGIDWDSDDVLSTGQACRGNDVSQLVWVGITERQSEGASLQAFAASLYIV